MNSPVDFLRFIRFSHTVFALPFALGAMFVAAGGLPSPRVFAGILAAMVCARTAAMTFNRVAEWEFDKRNPRPKAGTGSWIKTWRLPGAWRPRPGSSPRHGR